MKIFTRKMIVGTLCAITVGVLSALLLQGCGKTEKTKFEKVYDKIGGDVTVFQYTDTTDVFKEFGKYDVCGAIADFLDIQDQTVGKTTVPSRQVAIKFMKDLWNRSGIANISAVGTSVRPLKGNPDFYSYNIFMMSEPNPQGIIWDMCPSLETGFPMIEYVPANAWFASADMTNINPLVNGVMESMKENLPIVYTMISLKLAEIQTENKVDVVKVLNSLNGYGYFVSRDMSYKSKYLTCGITLVFRTTDDTFFKTIGALAEKNGAKIENGTYRFPIFENIKISIFKNGNDVLITTDEKAVKDQIANKAKCLADNPTFAKLRASLPEKASSWSYIDAGTIPTFINYLEKNFPADTKKSKKAGETDVTKGVKVLVDLLKSVKGPVVSAGVKEDDGLTFILSAQEKLPLLLLAQ